MNLAPAVTTMVSQIDLGSAWDKLLRAIGTSFDPILNVATVIGIGIIVVSLITWAWQRRRGGGGMMGQTGGIWGSLLAGAVLCAPKVIIPLFLELLDIIANTVINVWTNTTG